MPQIRVKNGQQKGKVLQVEGTSPIVIGREATSGLQIIDKGVSRDHAEIYRVGEMVFIRDLGSRNGTFVNEEQIEEELLREGDVVRVGTTQLTFESTKAAMERVGNVQFEEGEGFKTSLDLKVEDLFVSDSASTGRENEQFRAICQAAQIFNGERNEKKLFDRLMDLIQEYIPADYLYLFLRDESSGAIMPRVTRQKDSGGSILISRTILKRVITENRAILTADAMQDDRFKMGDSIMIHQIRSVLCVPVHSGTVTNGAIYAVSARLAETFDQTDMELLAAIGTQLSASMENLDLLRSRQKLFMDLTAKLTGLLESQAPLKSCHARRVSDYAGAIAVELGMPDQEVLYVRMAGLLHDLGKLSAVSGLSAQASERSHGAAHALRAEEFFAEVRGLSAVLPAIRGHHERFDGNGVPGGLKGEAIPLGARILAVADALDHLLFDHLPPGEEECPDAALVRKALVELGEKGDTQFDPAVVRTLAIAHRHGTLFPQATKELRAGDSTGAAPPVVDPVDTKAREQEAEDSKEAAPKPANSRRARPSARESAKKGAGVGEGARPEASPGS